MSAPLSRAQAAMDEQRAAPRYGRVLLALGLTLLASFAYKLRVDGIFACPADGYGPGWYLAYCNATAYGDYDHGAFWFGLEPRSAQAVAAAQVLFVGSSRMQFAFSTPATDDWFAQRRVPYYLLGFSHTETVVFAEPLIGALHPRARVYVINVDRFFHDRVTMPTQAIQAGGDVESRYRRRRLWQPAHRALCGALPALCGSELAFYRNQQTGQWRLRGSARLVATEVADGPPSDVEQWPAYARLAEEFLDHLPAPRDCVLFTIVPYEATKREEARSIAEAVGVSFVSPAVAGLSTFDGSHLDRASAQRWSQAFFDAAGPFIHRCLRRRVDTAQRGGAPRS